MKIIYDTAKNDINVTVFNNDFNLNELQKKTVITKEESLKINSFKSEKRKIEWLSIRLALQQKFGKNILLEYQGKKPFINKKKHFSLSHSNNMLALIDSNKHTIGIDIEKISPKIESLCEKFIHKEEKELIFNKEKSILTKHLIWCAKEAIYKSQNSNEIKFNQNIIINNINYKKNTAKGTLLFNNQKKYFLIQFKKINSYLLVFVIKI